MEWASLTFIALAATCLIMFLGWLWALKLDNFSIVDAIWAFCFLIQGLIFYQFSDGFIQRKIILLAMIGLWSFRLGYFLTRRIAGHHPTEDSRYKHLRSEYGVNYKFRFLMFYFMQALSVSILTLPFVFVFQNPTESINAFEIVGCIYWLIAVCGESVADHQMSEFKKISKENPKLGKTCNIGLWKYSRHPNYFFESQIWIGFFIFMMGSGVYWGIYSAMIILYLLLKVTGVPLSEEQSLKTRGDEYRRYMEKTSVFIPWFPKN